ncbi:MAG: hypothetical protein WEB53_08175 [Akkermansiaceae bacterium]|jgi:hypothetical protein
MQKKPVKPQRPVEHAERKAHHARSLPSRRPYDIAVGFCVIHFLGIIATVTALVIFFCQPSQLAVRFIVGGLIFCAITWLIAYLKRRSALCPLCKGTPLANSGARTHKKAVRIFPFNHGITAVLSILATHKFRCMYCASDFDLLRQPSRHLLGGKAGETLSKNRIPKNKG